MRDLGILFLSQRGIVLSVGVRVWGVRHSYGFANIIQSGHCDQGDTGELSLLFLAALCCTCIVAGRRLSFSAFLATAEANAVYLGARTSRRSSRVRVHLTADDSEQSHGNNGRGDFW